MTAPDASDRDRATTPRGLAFDPIRVAVAVALGVTLVAAGATLVVRERIADLPEIGRATPIEELRAAWAEADEEDARAASPTRRVPFTMPQPRPRPESRP